MRGLCLSGGGSKCAWQAGALVALAEDAERRAKDQYGKDYLRHAKSWDWAELSAVSGGAINAAKLGQFPLGRSREGAERLADMWRKLRNRDVKQGSAFAGLVGMALGTRTSVYRQRDRLGAMLRREVDLAKLRTSGRRVRVGAVSWRTSEYVSRDQKNDDFVDWVLASSAVPVLFEPVFIGGERYMDGGARPDGPLRELCQSELDQITVVATRSSGPDDFKPDGAVDDIGRLIEIVANVLSDTDSGDVDVHTFMPERELGEMHLLEFDPAVIDRWIEEGYEDASEALEEEYSDG